jgi:hypothetical protein
VVARASFDTTNEQPIAILSTSQANEFALVQKSGDVFMYRLAD